MKNDAITKALAIINRDLVVRNDNHHMQPRERPPLPATIPQRQQVIIDLPRICSIHNRPYMSRYINREYAQSIRVTHSLFRGQYEGNGNVQMFDGRDLSYEHCPWCGSYNDDYTGPIKCEKCNRLICYGTTVGNYTRCPCGAEGTLTEGSHSVCGLVPQWRSGSRGL